jgi:hypothetical protein
LEFPLLRVVAFLFQTAEHAALQRVAHLFGPQRQVNLRQVAQHRVAPAVPNLFLFGRTDHTEQALDIEGRHRQTP